MSLKFTDGALDRLVASDPAKFVHERRRLLAEFMSKSNGSVELLMDMQNTIDQTIAVSGSPLHAIEHLAGLIEDRLLMIGRLSRELALEVKKHQIKTGSHLL